MHIVRNCIIALALIVATLAPARAETYPSRPVKFIVSFAAGGANDIVARVICDALSDRLGQPFVVENRSGFGGNIGAQFVVNSAPDGYTIMFVGPNNAISASVYRKLPFDFLRDTTPVGGIMRLTNIMVVSPSLPVHTIEEFIAYAKANPGKLNMASPGAGTSPHMSGELFQLLAGITMQHVPYRGAAPAYPDLISGKVDLMFDNLPGSVGFVQSGKLRALGVTTAQRNFVFPEVPAIGEVLPGYEASVFYGVSAPRGTPPEIVAILNRALNDALADPRIKARIAELGGVPMPLTSAEFGKLVADETVKWEQVVAKIGLAIN
ncbi:MAG TPA: tripartite tricarboxylate transporter substrate binding protein [Xanthobacteraceae bacterium]|nr:tripartite tricarboxylate transporter substrate binding protein [Xanthobacteraceae bacterium]